MCDRIEQIKMKRIISAESGEERAVASTGILWPLCTRMCETV